MNYLFRAARLIVIVIMLSALTGCAAFFAGGNVPKTKLAAPTAEDQSKPTLSYQFIPYLDYVRDKKQNYRNVKQIFLEELHKSLYFKEITEGHSTEADIELDVIVKKLNLNQPDPDRSYPSLKAPSRHHLPQWSGTTIGLLPVWATDNYQVKVEVKSKRGLEKEYVVNDTITEVWWLPLVVFYPFQNFDLDEDVQSNMYRNIISQMYEDGFIGGN